jgi:hypothetical protein
MKKVKGFALKIWNWLKSSRLNQWLKDTFLVIAEIVIGLLMCLLFLIVSIIGFFYTLIKHLKKRDYSAKRQFQPIMRAFTLNNDCFANASGGEMLNDVFKVKEGEISYGNWFQTISAVTGLRLLFNKRDSKLRKFLDSFSKGHCETAPTEMEIYYYENKEL